MITIKRKDKTSHYYSKNLFWPPRSMLKEVKGQSRRPSLCAKFGKVVIYCFDSYPIKDIGTENVISSCIY